LPHLHCFPVDHLEECVTLHHKDDALHRHVSTVVFRAEFVFATTILLEFSRSNILFFNLKIKSLGPLPVTGVPDECSAGHSECSAGHSECSTRA
jgi:hypothetical protein